MKTIIVLADIGSSATRALYWDKSQTESAPKVLWMSPEVLQLSPMQLRNVQLTDEFSKGPPEQRAYVSFNERAYALGALARAMQGSVEMEMGKYKNAIPKVLGILGAILQQLRVDHRVNIYLAILFPVDEFLIDSPGVVKVLNQLAQFEFRNHQFSIQLEQIRALPEGIGIYFRRAAQLTELGQSYRDFTLVVIMIGHRDLSLLIFNQGNLGEASTSKGPGFKELLRACAKEIPSLHYDDPGLFHAVLQGESELDFRGQKHTLAQLVSEARVAYWQQVEQFLERNLPSFSQEVLIAGGAAEWFRPELEGFFAGRSMSAKVFWNDQLHQEVEDVFRLDESMSAQVSCIRLADAYSAFKWFFDGVLNAHDAA